MREITVGRETIEPNPGAHEVVAPEGAQQYSSAATLTKADYDRWTEGLLFPARMAGTAFRFLLARQRPPAILATFDCAVSRRYFREVNRELVHLL